MNINEHPCWHNSHRSGIVFLISMYDNIENMNVLFNIQNFNNINVQNDRLLNVDPDNNHLSIADLY